MSDSKDPAEIITVTFPYGGELGAAAIQAGPVITIEVVNGADPGVAAMLNGAAEVQGEDVLQSVKDGVDAVDYKLRCVATLSDGRKLVRAITLPVRRR